MTQELTVEQCEAEARAIVAEVAAELGYMDFDVETFLSGPLDGDDLLPVRAVERALARHRAETLAASDKGGVEPISMLLYCPECGLQHIDEPEHVLVWTGGSVPEPSHDEVVWDNPPHKSHLCHGCGCIWRPADVPTNGVASIETVGKADTWTASPAIAAISTPDTPNG